MSKRYDESIQVEVKPSTSELSSFEWRGRHYAVERLLKQWREAGEGWDPEKARDHECFRVEAEGGIYDLYLDRLAGRGQPEWWLSRVWD